MKHSKTKICVATGSRAEYGILKSAMKAIKNAKNLELQILVAGMHLSPEFGNTIKEIKKDGFGTANKVVMTAKKDSTEAMAASVGAGIIGMVKVFKKIKPDIVLIIGDRIEALAAAIAARYMNIVLAHIHGGDSAYAGFDEYARHAITKLSNIHFPATKKSAQRIIKMGEDKSRVFVVGAPALDNILEKKLLSSEKISKKYGLDLKKPIFLMVQHPVSTESKNAAKQIKETLEAIIEEKQQTVIIYPNADAGGRSAIKVIKSYEKCSFLKVYKSIPHEDYFSLMKIASILIGNSSSGIIEAPSFHLPVINIGSRQAGRESAGNTINVGYNKEQIRKAIQKALYDKNFKEKVGECKSPYGGKEKSGIKIAKILGEIEIGQKLLEKKLTY